MSALERHVLPAFRTIVADDEEPSLNGLMQQVRAIPELELIGAYDNGAGLLEGVRKHRPDIVFLDIQMPIANGIEVARQLDAHSAPVLVFVTAFDSYALEAFGVHAGDYLLKPFDGKRFRQSAQWAISHASLRRAAAQNEAARRALGVASPALAAACEFEPASCARPMLERFTVKEDGRAHLINVSDVEWIEALGAGCLLHVRNARHRIRRSLADLEASLPPTRFARINKSTIVNLDQIAELQQLFHGRYAVIMKSGAELSLSRRYRRMAKVLSDGL